MKAGGVMSLFLLSLVGVAVTSYKGVKKIKSGGEKIVDANKKIGKAYERDTGVFLRRSRCSPLS